MRFHKTLFCTVALYHIALQNEITAYQLAPMPGRIFFRNVGRSRRTGIETALQWSPLPGLALQMHGTLTDFRYRRYESAAGNFDGKRPPLQPRIAAFALLQWESRSGWFVALQTQHQGKVFLNDANDAIAPAYTLTALRSSKTFRYRHYALEPFVGVQNALYQPYYNNLLVNAPGNRFFEPAPDFATFYGGIVVRLRQM
jgi:iron complex outermembrane receptor protein